MDLCTSEVQIFLGIIVSILDLVYFLIPIILIILCTIDVFKIIVAKKDDVKKLRTVVISRIIYGILIYSVPFLINLLFNLSTKIIDSEYNTNWKVCYDLVKKANK